MNELMMSDINNEFNEDTDVIQLVGMKLGDEEYAIDVLKIQEIIRTVEITIVPRVENYVLGVMNIRGKVIPVVDLRVRFNLDKVDFDKATRIIVARFERENIGFVVDEVTQVIRIKRSMVEPTPPLVGAVGQEYILGICKYNERLIILLDIDRIVGENSEMMDSALRQRFLGTKDKKGKKPAPAVALAPVAQEAAPVAAAPKEVPAYSQAGEIPPPEIQFSLDDEDEEDHIDSVLNDAVQQSKVIDKPSAHVEQSDIDAAMGKAAEPAAEMSMDELIAMELAKREAETAELNAKRRAEQADAEKKNDIDSDLPADFSISKIEDQQEEEAATEVEATSDSADSSAPAEKPSLTELKEIARRIINGEASELDLNIKGEVGELIKLLVDIKGRIDEIPPTVLNSQQSLPNMASTLTDVNSTTEKAAFNLLQNAQRLGDFYKGLQKEIEQLDRTLKAKDDKSFGEEKEKISTLVGEAGDLGLHILEALEFQDITEQKLRKVIKSIEEVGARFGTIVGIMKSKEGHADYDKLLEDLGFA
ncbi:MAG: chemotaxis protein CheW [Deferribacteraceae bacterium]|jgi:chemotaxis signal transduction protein/chemotaxis regulatin CheY-phosphate phosphatase CheZ|nr:chemotaxis protein CheW [Deferribacteraceae bacterium]